MHYEEHNTNDFVKMLKDEKGIKHMILINPKTPTDALDFIRDELNKTLGVGAPRSFMEVMKTVETQEAGWKRVKLIEKQTPIANEDGDEVG
jgi:pentose-5-phosphate-3-epimerase